jgi:hypothetical protein
MVTALGSLVERHKREEAAFVTGSLVQQIRKE